MKSVTWMVLQKDVKPGFSLLKVVTFEVCKDSFLLLSQRHSNQDCTLNFYLKGNKKCRLYLTVVNVP